MKIEQTRKVGMYPHANPYRLNTFVDSRLHSQTSISSISSLSFLIILIEQLTHIIHYVHFPGGSHS